MKGQRGCEHCFRDGLAYDLEDSGIMTCVEQRCNASWLRPVDRYSCLLTDSWGKSRRCVGYLGAANCFTNNHSMTSATLCCQIYPSPWRRERRPEITVYARTSTFNPKPVTRSSHSSNTMPALCLHLSPHIRFQPLKKIRHSSARL